MKKIKIRFKNRKANIPITLLVFMALVLTVYALYSFNTNDKKVSSEVSDSRFLDYIYSQENEINFYVGNVMEKSIAKTGQINSGNYQAFIDNFKIELYKYKKNQTFIITELSQIEPQLIGDNIEITDKFVSLNLNIKIEKKFHDKFIISYLYNKKFVKSI
ncbi:Uncharacterised protein [uncultured archaeon]|nr:Uncharacterised protein [uncultured archaeon]